MTFRSTSSLLTPRCLFASTRSRNPLRVASDCASVTQLPGAPEPLSGAVWNCTAKVTEPPEVKGVTTWQSSASRSTAALPMSRLLPRSIVWVDAVAPVAVTACWSENWFCESMSMEGILVSCGSPPFETPCCARRHKR